MSAPTGRSVPASSPEQFKNSNEHECNEIFGVFPPFFRGSLKVMLGFPSQCPYGHVEGSSDVHRSDEYEGIF